MANPNLLNATSMYAKTIAHSSGASATLLTCPSDKLIKIVKKIDENTLRKFKSTMEEREKKFIKNYRPNFVK